MKNLLYMLVGLVLLVGWWYLLSDGEIDSIMPADQDVQQERDDTSPQEQPTKLFTTTWEAQLTGSTGTGAEEFNPEQFEDEEIEELLQLMEEMLSN